jgi:hypothetical protein
MSGKGKMRNRKRKGGGKKEKTNRYGNYEFLFAPI